MLAVASLAAVLVVRNALVEEYSESDPAFAARIWPNHPDVALNVGFAQIGRAAGLGQQPPEAAFAAVAAAARRAPLAAEPFLVRGVSAQVGNDLATAERAFREAERRNPRSRAAHYFLAELYLRAGRTADALREISVLSRLLPGSGGSLAPYLAQFARTPGAAADLKGLFREQPELQPAVLGELAKDPANAELVLSLAESSRSTGDQSWKTRLLDALVNAGEFDKAREAWSRLTGIPARRGLFDAEFRGSTAPPPFNWSFAAGSGGLAETAGGSLHVIYYGRDQAVLASQLLTLEAGRYRLAMRLAGSRAKARSLAWRLGCFPNGGAIGEVSLGEADGGGRLMEELTVPAGCLAQRLELVGMPGDVSTEVDVNISELSLSPAGRS